MENELKNSENFIQQKAGNKNSFSVPSNYFEEIENNFATRLFKEKHKSNNAFETPLDYFDTLEDKILDKVSSEKKSFKTKVFKLIPYTAAASILLFIGLNTSFFGNNETPTFNNLAIEDIENWYENGYSTIDNNDLAVVFEASDFDENDFDFTTINDNSIENFINSSDDNTLLNELY